MIREVSACFDDTVIVSSSVSVESEGQFKQGFSLVGILFRVMRSAQGFFRLARQRSKLADAGVVFLPYPAYFGFFALQVLLLFRKNRPLILLDAFLCLYDTVVEDRKITADGSLVSSLVKWLEKRTLQAADLVFIDTTQQKTALLQRYGLVDRKLVVTPVGIDESVWRPVPMPPLEQRFTVVFWGTFIPLHGIGTIIKAARIIANERTEILFKIIGDGQTAPEIQAMLEQNPLSNIDWMRKLLSAEQLQHIVSSSHCVLGIFGESKKAGDVIPYKAYQALASNRPLITRSGPAIAELLGESDPVGLLLVNTEDPGGLAEEIVRLFDNYANLASQIDTVSLYREKLSSDVLARSVGKAVSTVCESYASESE
ncbi:MAG: glycosyltransferase [Halioglobus sp.]|nr:glycosyltransferase [Halioglobus sp.]